MRLKELTYIITIAEEGSISHAADKLFMAQSSLSEFLKQYEAELKTKLFMRTSTGVRPTSSGKLFVENANRMLKHFHQLEKEISDIEELKGGTIDLGISTFRGTYLLPGVLHEFYKQYPGIRVKIHENNSMELEQEILEGKLDIALVALPLTRLKSGSDFLIRDEICIVTAKNHPAASYAKISSATGLPYLDLADTENFGYILSERDTILGFRAREAFSKAGIVPLVSNDNLTAPFAAAMARQGLGLAFTYRSCIGEEKNAKYLSVGAGGEYLNLALVYPDGYRSKAARALGDMFHEYFKDFSPCAQEI